MSLKKEHARGASESLNKTITEIMDFMKDDSERPKRELRDFLHDKIGDLAEKWFRRGFNRGHRESYDAFKSDNAVPVILEFDCNRRLSPNQHRELELRSKIKKKSR